MGDAVGGGATMEGPIIIAFGAFKLAMHEVQTGLASGEMVATSTATATTATTTSILRLEGSVSGDACKRKHNILNGVQPMLSHESLMGNEMHQNIFDQAYV